MLCQQICKFTHFPAIYETEGREFENKEVYISINWSNFEERFTCVF